MPKMKNEFEGVPTRPEDVRTADRKLIGKILKVYVRPKLDFATGEPAVRDGKTVKQLCFDIEFPYCKTWDPPWKTATYTINGRYFEELVNRFYEFGYEVVEWPELEGETFEWEEVMVEIPGRSKPWRVYYPVAFVEA